MIDFLTKKQKKRIYNLLLENLDGYILQTSMFSIDEEKVRICFNPAYSDHRVISLHELPELWLFAPDWNSDHKVCRCDDWFKGAEQDPCDKYHTEHKKMIIEFCLMLVDEEIDL